MSHATAAARPRQATQLCHSLHQTDALPFAQLMDRDTILQAFCDEPLSFRDRLFTPISVALA